MYWRSQAACTAAWVATSINRSDRVLPNPEARLSPAIRQATPSGSTDSTQSKSTTTVSVVNSRACCNAFVKAGLLTASRRPFGLRTTVRGRLPSIVLAFLAEVKIEFARGFIAISKTCCQKESKARARSLA